MAIMIPDKPHEFEPASQEGLMFDALKKLPDEYYVFHSFRITSVNENTFYESETDFVIFNRKYGVICLEAKSGEVRYEDGYWYYASGIPMHNGGPFNQASSNKYKLIRYIERSNVSSLLLRCKFLHGVWFPSVTDNHLKAMTFPSEADKTLVLTKEALEEPQKYIDKIFAVNLANKIETDLSTFDEKKLVREIFCPRFNVFPSASFEDDLKKIVFHRLLKEQSAILDFLTEQKSAVINGMAGTGKTMIAVEKAHRHASQGDSVLFLCYNAKLRNFLSENYHHDLISYYTISGLACKMCNTVSADYNKFKALLEDMYLCESFPYKHVIIDEGQDFGSDSLEEHDIINQIKDIIIDKENGSGTFYVFYDRLQMIQADKMPNFIEDADCKLTLYRNCRNTENIATTSLRPVVDKRPILLDGCVKGTPAKLHFCDSSEKTVKCIDMIIDTLKTDGYKDIVILTCKTEETSVLSNLHNEGLYRNKYLFTTCRKFKGLEADAVILIDIDKDTFEARNSLLFYVGSSRARLKLDIVTTLNEEECTDILRGRFNYQGKIKRPQRELATELNSVGSIINS